VQCSDRPSLCPEPFQSLLLGRRDRGARAVVDKSGDRRPRDGRLRCRIDHEAGEVAVRGAGGERAVESIAQAVGKEELGDGEGAVSFGHAQDVPAVQLAAVDHVMLQMDTALWKASAARTVEPECAIIPTRFRRL